MYVCDNVVVLMSPCCFLFSYWKWWFVVNNHKITLLKNEGTRKKNQNIPHCSQNHQNTWNIETWWPVKGKKKKIWHFTSSKYTNNTHTHNVYCICMSVCFKFGFKRPNGSYLCYNNNNNNINDYDSYDHVWWPIPMYVCLQI